MSSRKKITTLFWIIIPLIVISGILWSIISPSGFYAAQSYWRDLIARFGSFGPIIFVLVQVLQVVVAPIGHYGIGALGGFLYGTFLGTILNYVGRFVGSILAFSIARKFGRKLVLRFVDERTIRKYDHYVSGGREPTRQVIILFLVYALPFFPKDEITYLVGISKMHPRHFILANIFGQISGSLATAYIGSGVHHQDVLFWFPFIVCLLGFPLLFYLVRSIAKANPSD
ncbi:MAG: hypothetical protein GTO24_23755 [candidate division Zixibacteria bacterium]|nr:hypothetical protein [candidate division Zixibacteria bacterium]